MALEQNQVQAAVQQPPFLGPDQQDAAVLGPTHLIAGRDQVVVWLQLQDIGLHRPKLAQLVYSICLRMAEIRPMPPPNESARPVINAQGRSRPLRHALLEPVPCSGCSGWAAESGSGRLRSRWRPAAPDRRPVAISCQRDNQTVLPGGDLLIVL